MNCLGYKLTKYFSSILLIACFTATAACTEKDVKDKKKGHLIPAETPESKEPTKDNPFPHCGDDIINYEDGEECDNLNLAGKNCHTLEMGYSAGILKCSDHCKFDTSDCIFATEDCIGMNAYPRFTLENDMPCNFDYECQSGLCAKYLFVYDGQTDIPYTYCAAKQPAVNTPLPIKKDLADGYPCWADAECSSSYCWWGRDINMCVSVCDHDTNVGQGSFTCQDDRDSKTGQSCLPASKNGEGSPCRVADFDCAPGLLCILGYCTKRCANQNDEECKSGLCLTAENGYPSVCLVEDLEFTIANGGTCYSDFHCQSEYCHNNICEEAAPYDCFGPAQYPVKNVISNGYPCNYNTDCLSGTCNNNICGPVNTPPAEASNLPLHYPCSKDSQCRSKLCLEYSEYFSICASSCKEGAKTDGLFDCQQINSTRWGCMRNNTATSELNPCLSTAYDCGSKALCCRGICVEDPDILTERNIDIDECLD